MTSAALALAVAACGGTKDIRKDAATVPTVAAVLPFPPARVVTAMERLFSERRAELEPPLDQFTLAAASDPVFPEDEQIRFQLTGNDALARFASQLPGARADAYYLFEPTFGLYWPSEYVYDGKPADFRTAFIVHLRKESTNATTVEVIEYLPTIKVGKALKLGHAGPGYYADIRPVDPTTRDRERVLDAIKRGLEP